MLNEKLFHVAAYCPPNPAEKGRPSQICDEQYGRMRDVGIDLVYGHNEMVGGGCEKETFTALQLCERYGLKYLVKDKIYQRFTVLRSDKFKVFRKLSAREKRALGEEYKVSLERYSNFVSFGGVEFIDEPGFEMFDGIRFAKDVFEKNCPGNLFYVNMLPYWTLCAQLQYGMEYPFFKKKNAELYTEPKQCRYAYYLRSYLKTVQPRVLSYDAYPILTLGAEEKTVHVALYDHLRIASALAKENGIPFWNFIQAGGKWEGCANIRVPVEAEIALQINVSLAFGATGIEIFPYAYPNDWAEDTVACAGLIGREGEKTELYSIFKRRIADARYYGEKLVGLKNLYVSVSGEFCGGLSPYAERLNIPDHDCIFDGNLPYKKIEGVRQIVSDSQVLTGVFGEGGKIALFIVNNSIIKETRVRLIFERTVLLRLFFRGAEEQCRTEQSQEVRLLPGEGFLAEFERIL